MDLSRVSEVESCVILMLLSDGVKHSRPSSYLHAVTGMGVLAADQIANRSLVVTSQRKGHHKVIMQLIQLIKFVIVKLT